MKQINRNRNKNRVKAKIVPKFALIFSYLIIAFHPTLFGQESRLLTLENAFDLALQNNHLLNVKKLQVEEKLRKVNEDMVKFLPTVIIGGSYQYNTNLPSLTLEQGRFGKLPYGGIFIPLPAADEVIQMGNHDIYNAGITVYQPITQIGKINAGARVSKTELQIARTEESKAVLQIKQSVEKLYYGLLITSKLIEEADLKVLLSMTKLHDAESAVSAGKTTESSKFALAAASADEEQNLLKLKIQYDDYAADLKQLTGLDPMSELSLEPVLFDLLTLQSASNDTSLNAAGLNNNDLKIALLATVKADYSVKASKFSYLPDLGIMGGYTYQDGSVIYPKNNSFIGASLKWNLQEILSNRTVQMQRTFIKKQAEENLANTRGQVDKDIAKVRRKLKQSEELIKVAGKVVEFRREDLKIQSDKHSSGLNLESDLLTAKAAMAKAESDLFAAQMNYRIALSELQILRGTY